MGQQAAGTDPAPGLSWQVGDSPAGEMRRLTGELRRNPQDFRALHRLGLLTYEAGRLEPAVALLRRAASAAPRAASAAILSDLGALTGLTGDHPAAVAALEDACALDPRNGAAWYNLATLLRRASRYRDAAEAFGRATRLSPDDCSAPKDRAVCLAQLGEFDAAAAAFETAARRAEAANGTAAEIADLRHSAALAHLSAGRLAEGWARYDWRRETAWFGAFAVEPPIPAYAGERLQGRRIAVIGEQGVGDEINFAGLVPDLLAQGAAVQLHADRRLVPLFRRSFPAVEVVALPSPRGGALALPGEVDTWADAGSLCRWLRPHKGAFGDGAAYLEADPARRAALRARYGDERLRVGIAWRTSNPSNGFRRSLPLAQWGPILTVPGVTFVNLQYGDVRAEIDIARARFAADIVEDAEVDPLADLDGFAAQVAALDLVITIDNAAAHMAGALGVPTLLLLPSLAEWRWFDEPRRSLWYASVSLLRQREIGEWGPVVEAAAERLRTEACPAVSVPTATPAPAGPSVLLLNDTAEWYHWGCTGTSLALQRVIAALGHRLETVAISAIQTLLPVPATLADFRSPAFFARFRQDNPRLVAKLEAADIVVVNGEGTLHGTRASVRSLLYLAQAARLHLGKPVQIVNHSCFPPDDEAGRALYREVYGGLDYVAVREPLSRQALAALDVPATLAFDCLPLFIADHYRRPSGAGEPNVVIAGSVALGEADFEAFAGLARALAARGYPVKLLHGAAALPAEEDRRFATRLQRALGGGAEIVEARSITQWLDAIAGASCLVSGRFHYNIAAAALGTPFVATTSNTGKMEAFLALIEHAPALALGTPALGERLLAETEAALAREPRPDPALAEALQALALRNFDGLLARRRRSDAA